MSEFVYSPAEFVPFKDVKEVERCRNIKKEDITKHSNPDFKIHLVKDHEIGIIWLTDMFHRIKTAADEGRRLVMILPNPAPQYKQVAYMINRFRVDCKHLWAFAMDEYANEHGEIAPETWRPGFTYAMLHNFFYAIDEDLRPPRKQFVGFTNKNVNDYSKMMEDMGGADVCYSGPGWSGHLAFIEPDAPEFQAPLEEWKKMGARICTLSPLTICQNSLHGSFGSSGDLTAVPPKAATIGPADVIGAKNRLDFMALTVHGSFASWQRMVARLCLHGPVTPLLPTSIHQTLRTDSYISETLAANVEPHWDKGY